MLYKYVGTGSEKKDIKRLKNYVEDGTIFASDPRTFNDPAEFKIRYNFDADDEAKKARYEQFSGSESYEDWINLFGTKSSYINDFLIRDKFLKLAGVFCLTSSCDNYLMWSHYAHSHTGFCIGFDDKIKEITKPEDEPFSSSNHVKYLSETPTINFFNDDDQIITDTIFFSKSDIWQGEDEYRIIFKGSGLVEFDKSLIKEIILGCKVHPRLRQYVNKYIGTNIDIYWSGNSPQEYLPRKEKIEDVNFETNRYL